MKKKFLRFFPLFIFLILTIAIFRPYFFSHKVPLPGNLLVAFYEPWKSYPIPNYPNGPANKPIGFDSLRIFYPYRALTTEYLKNGHIPLWNIYTFSGNMYLAAYQTAVFSPVDLFFFIFPVLDAWSLMVILAPFFTALATYWFLRSLTISQKASVIGALAFGFSGIVVAFTEEWYIAAYGILFMPLILLAIYQLKQKISIRYFLLLIFSLSGSILSGWFQITFYSFLLAVAWTIFLFLKDKNKKWLWFVALGFFTSFLLCGIYLVPNIQAFFYSARSSTDAKYIFELYLLPVSRLITYVIPDFWGNPASYNYFGGGFYQEKILYIGIVGLFFGIYSFLKRKQLSSINTFFLVSWLIFLSLGLSLPTSWFLLYYLHVPLVKTLVPSRIIIVAAFCLAISSAYGFDLYIKEKKIKDIVYTTIPLVILFLVGGVIVVFEKLHYPYRDYAFVSAKNMFLPVIFLLLFFFILFLDMRIGKRLKKWSYALFLLVTLVPLFYFANKYLYFSERQFTFPKVPVLQKLQQIEGNDRMISFGKGYIETNLTVAYHLYSVEGYDSFFIDRYGELVASTANGGKTTKDIARANVNFGIPGRLEDIVKKNEMMKIWSLLDVRYIVGKKNIEDEEFVRDDPQKHFSLMWTDGIYSIYKNNTALPKAFLLGKSIAVTSDQEVLNKMYDKSTDLSKEVILEKNISGLVNTSDFSGNANVVSYKPEEVVIKTTSNEDGFLVLSDNYYPGWNVYVDGKKQEILRVDYALRGVQISKGTHSVVFLFQPESVVVGWWISGFGLFSLLVFSFYIHKKK